MENRYVGVSFDPAVCSTQTNNFLKLSESIDEQVDTKIEPSKKNPSAVARKTERRIILMDQLSLFSVPLVYVLAVAVIMAKHA